MRNVKKLYTDSVKRKKDGVKDKYVYIILKRACDISIFELFAPCFCFFSLTKSSVFY